jgi:hypothetical protein
MQDLKQDVQIVLIDEGIHILRSDEQDSKADFPRSRSREPLSNVKLERPQQRRKQNSQIVSIDEVMQIDLSDEH